MDSRGRAADRHIPVLRDRILDLLAPALTEPGSVYVDATLGMGGHAQAVLERCPNARLVGIDRDQEALALAGERLEPYAARVTLVHAVYDEFADVVHDLGLPEVHAALFDLGVSSLQLDEADRGFSYAQDAPLDMRMDASSGQTAADVLNTYPSADLARVISRYGEERFARRIAERVVRERAMSPLTSSARLVELIREAIPAAARRTGGNPAKRTFQALRIEVNDELGALERALPAAIDALAVGGRVVVMSYQSLEDRIVKQALQARTVSTAPPDVPLTAEQDQTELRLLTRGAEQAPSDEVVANPRAASVRVRAAERRREAA
jgi:16S rRNA (cytosine1402-N4)-methyltransferase